MFRKSFGKEMMKYLSLIVMVQLLLMSLAFSWDISAYTHNYQKELVLNNLKAQVKLTDDWIALQQRLISQYCAIFEKTNAALDNKSEVKAFVQGLADENPVYKQVYFTSESGINVISNDVIARVDGRERIWYKGATVREFYISQPYIDVISGDYVITLSKAIRNSSQQVVGVLGVDLTINELLNKMKLIDPKLIDGVIMTDASRAVLFSDLNASYKRLDNGEIKSFDELDSEQNEVISLFSQRMNTNIIVLLRQGNYLVDLIKNNYDFWIALLAGILGLIIVLGYISRVISEPVKLLAQNIKRIANRVKEGDISQENLDVDLQEVYVLFKSLDAHIRSNIRQINQMNENMRQANEILEQKNEEFQHSMLELKFTNQDLKASEVHYQNLIDNIEELIWVADLSGNIVYANDKFYNWLGMSNVNQIELHLKDFIDELKHASQIKGVGFFANRDFYDLDMTLSHPWANKPIDLLVHTTVIYFKNEPMSVQFIGQDVTDERRLYQQYAQKNREMMILNDISRSLTMKEDLDSILQLITDRISNLIKVDGVTIRMLNDKEELVLKAVSGTEIKYVYLDAVNIHDVLMGRALIEERPIALTSIEELTLPDPHLTEILNKQGAVYYFPLMNRNNRFGVLTVISQSKLDLDTMTLFRSLSENASTAIEKASLFEKLRSNYLMTIEALSNALEEKVFNYKNHTKRVAEFARLIAERFYLSQKELDDIYISGLLHDIGKLGIADDLLNRDIQLTDDEYLEMMAHVEIGKRILEPIGLSEQIVEGIYLHHKNYDMTGHPEHINITKLPMFAKIIGVADAFDSALIDAKNQSEWALEFIISQLEMSSGTLYCPDVLAALKELIEIKRSRVLEISNM